MSTLKIILAKTVNWFIHFFSDLAKTFIQVSKIIINWVMKVSEKSDSKKKEKSALVKAVSSSLLGKKSDLRKLRIGVKEETVAPAPRKPELKSPTIHTASTSNSKSTSGSSSNVARSSKFGICSTRASPKYHLVEITSIYSKKPSCESIVFMPMSKTSSKI